MPVIAAAAVDPLSATKDLLVERLDPLEGFEPRLPDPVAATMPRQLFVVSGSGGPGSGGFLPSVKQRIDIRSYGATDDEAMDVAIAIHSVLKNLKRTVVGATLLRAFDASSGFVNLNDGGAGRWPLVLRTYLLTYDERPVT